MSFKSIPMEPEPRDFVPQSQPHSIYNSSSSPAELPEFHFGFAKKTWAMPQTLFTGPGVH